MSAAGGPLYVADTNNHSIRVVDSARGETRTLALTNLAVLAGSGPAAETVQLQALEVAPGAGVLRVRITTPGGYHLNSLAPGRLSLAASNQAIVELSEREVGWQTDDGAVEFPIPANFSEGETTLTGSLEAYYCRDGAEALCFIHRVSVAAAVTVLKGSRNGEALLEIALPAETP